ncbi:MAG: hypothetical protein ACLQLC_01635 [Candidatus Sulfotelmatobacter sp.]
MPPLNATGRTKVDPAHERNFDGPIKRDILNGPQQLYRFGLQPGLWWYDDTVLKEMREEYMEANLNGLRSNAVDVMMFPRSGLAISRQWNKLGWVTTMELRHGQSLEAWVGRTSPQPEWTNLPDGRILNGGLVQYLIYDVNKAPGSIFSKQTTISLFEKWGRSIAGVRIKNYS